MHLLVEKADLPADPAWLFNSLSDLPGSILLDSGMKVEGLARHSFIMADPFLVFASRGDKVLISRRHGPADGCREVLRGNPFGHLKTLLQRYNITEKTGFPFSGGAAGYFAYDLARQLEDLPALASDDLALPDCWLGFYDVVAVVDRLKGETCIVSSGLPEKGSKAYPRAHERLAWLKNIIGRGRPQDTRLACRSASGWYCGFDRKAYCAAVEKVREYIAAGDIFQVNLSQRFSFINQSSPWEVYRRLDNENPAPMAAYLNTGEMVAVCSSPERFLKVVDGMVETRPIKGTRPRGGTKEEDRKLAKELWNSAKDRAELAMIVDLERNDLSRVCTHGSVKVASGLYRLERHPTVHHLVSTVEGTLEKGKDVIDLLQAAFPGGSITGAPKIRAMEIIEELEPVRRGIYCGSIGYLGFNGNADLNIVIRTLLFLQGKAYLQVGGGITYDSDSGMEYQETLDKAAALVRALGIRKGFP